MNKEATMEFYIDQSGIVRWESNSRVPFDDMLSEFVNDGLISEETKTVSSKVRAMEVTQFLAEYRRNYTGPTEEERFEARAAHGPGVTLVNLITGTRWTT